MEATDSSPLYEACPACGSLLDVTDAAPFSQVFCPSCGQGLRARKQFNNFTLLEVLGEGGMGSVFKALDVNLQRYVALKILRKEVSANEDEKRQLENEARITASINHPHVVKVYSYGEDHGQFYFAMELVEKGSLDDLMSIQRRIAEVQMLEVAIQVAQGLQAAFEKGLIHRDLKPGNILFSDAHTAKLVDFGLALLMAEEATARGEIWGTPYYIAPEKLDNRPEDFRSDIYSLGGTLFHALAGRPPYEAETASMVALKQIKSRPVSLQAFAPDVSSETAYVINRMLAKEPDDRYQSYDELIDHLSYARQKLLERTEKPRQPKQRAIVTSEQETKFGALITIGILIILLVAGGVTYALRDKIFGGNAAGVAGLSPSAQAYSTQELEEMFAQGRRLIIDGQYGEAAAELEKLSSLPGLKPPLQKWIQLTEGLAFYLAEDPEKARQIFSSIQKAGLFSKEAKDNQLADFFVEVSRLMALPDPISPSTARMYALANFEAYALLLFGLKSWELGDPVSGGAILERFAAAKINPNYAWMAEFQPLAKKYAEDYRLYKGIEAAAKAPGGKEKALQLLEEARGQVQTGSRFSEALDQLQTKLESGT